MKVKLDLGKGDFNEGEKGIYCNRENVLIIGFVSI